MNNGKTDTSYTGIELKREKCLCQQEWIEIEYNAKLPDLDSGVIQYHSILWEGDGGGWSGKKEKYWEGKVLHGNADPLHRVDIWDPLP